MVVLPNHWFINPVTIFSAKNFCIVLRILIAISAKASSIVFVPSSTAFTPSVIKSNSPSSVACLNLSLASSITSFRCPASSAKTSKAWVDFNFSITALSSTVLPFTLSNWTWAPLSSPSSFSLSASLLQASISSLSWL